MTDRKHENIHQKLLSNGFRPVSVDFSLDKLLYSMTFRGEEIKRLIGRILGSLMEKYLESTTRDPLQITLLALNSPETKTTIEGLSSMATEVRLPKDINPPNYGESLILSTGISNNEEKLPFSGDPVSSKINYYIVTSILDYLRQEEKGTTILRNWDYPTAEHLYIGECRRIDDGDSYIIDSFTKEFYLDGIVFKKSINTTATLGEFFVTLYIQREGLLDRVFSGKGCRISQGSVTFGDLKEFYPLDSFHHQAQSLYKDAKSLVEKEDKGHKKILIKGPSGTCKSQWARSFAKYYLSPRGYFTMIMSPDCIDEELIPSYMPKVCIIVDEFSAENRTACSYTKEMTENLLRIFDDTCFEDINPRYQPDKKQSIVWVLTSNYEKEQSYDPAFLRRIDIIRDFTIDAEGKESSLSIGY
jgi:hypothetical protein